MDAVRSIKSSKANWATLGQSWRLMEPAAITRLASAALKRRDWSETIELASLLIASGSRQIGLRIRGRALLKQRKFAEASL